jgi:hypothetical protein
MVPTERFARSGAVRANDQHGPIGPLDSSGPRSCSRSRLADATMSNGAEPLDTASTHRPSSRLVRHVALTRGNLAGI